MAARIQILTIVALGGALLAGCAGMPDQAQQTAARKECKIVLVDSTAKELRAYKEDDKNIRQDCVMALAIGIDNLALAYQSRPGQARVMTWQ